MKRKLAFLTALIMGMSAVSVTNVVDSDYITASAETTNPELPELKKELERAEAYLNTKWFGVKSALCPTARCDTLEVGVGSALEI